MMGIISKESIACCARVEGMRGEIFAMSPIKLQSRWKRVPNEPIPMYGHSWPHCQCVSLTKETQRVRRNVETAIGGWYAMRGVVSVSNGSGLPSSSQCSERKNGLVQVQSSAKTWPAVSWRVKPGPVPVNLWVSPGLAWPVGSNLRFYDSGFSIYCHI